MRIQANTDLHQHNFDLLEQISLTIPNHFSAINQVEEVQVQLQGTKFHQMLDQLIIEFVFDLSITYNGVNHLTYTVNHPITSLQRVEKPRGNVIQIFTENINLRQDYQLKMPTATSKNTQVRQFDLLLFLQVQYYLGANLKQTGPTAPQPPSSSTSISNNANQQTNYNSTNSTPSSNINSTPHPPTPQEFISQASQLPKRKWQHNGMNWYK